jgi:hypothetical protein
MELKIKEDAGNIFFKNQHLDLTYAGGISPQAREFSEKITAIQGMTIVVETKYLWGDQFNTAPIEGISECGLRILDFKGETSIIEEIIDDARPGRAKCVICEHYLREDDIIDDPCWWCGK